MGAGTEASTLSDAASARDKRENDEGLAKTRASPKKLAMKPPLVQTTRNLSSRAAPKMSQARRPPVQIVAGQSYLRPDLKEGNVMDEQERSNNFIGGIALVLVLVFASMGWVWMSNGRLGSEARAEVPPPPKAASPADATAGLEKRVTSLEAKAKTPPASDSSQLEAQIKDLGSQLTAIQTQLGSFKVSDFDALKTKVDTKGDKTATANSESVKKSIDSLQTDIGNLHTRFDQLSQQVASVTAPDAKANSTVHEVKNSPHSKSK
jgi:hypothetical protein